MKIVNLVKTFNNNKEEIHAVNDVSFTLPSKGMVFIVGKSGSGKSTLLNLLSGLDTITSGDVVVNSKSLKGMSNKELEEYRSNYFGFVFQDCCLIDNLTIFENIKLALSIIGDEDDELVLSTLNKVGILDQKDKYPNELSAGQKQRVAIARAIVKESTTIFCDEPTGNLDNKTGKQILDLLKEISSNKLVVIVSHNLDDAYFYGDRIIELSDGKVKADLTKDNNKTISNKTLIVNNFNNLPNEEIDKLNKSIKDGLIEKIVPQRYLFKNSEEIKEEVIINKKKNKALSIKNSLLLAGKLIKSRIFSLLICAILTSLIIGLFYLSQSFISYNENIAISQSLESKNSINLVLKKAYFDEKKEDKIITNKLLEITKSDETLIKESGYTSEYYKLINYSLPISLTEWTLQTENTVPDERNIEHIFIKEIYGVLPTSETYLNNVFNNGDDISYLAKSGEYKNYGVYITDFVADSILHYRHQYFVSYEDILGVYKNNSDSIYGYINGIINTSYKEKHKEILTKLSDVNNDKDKLSDLYKSVEYCNFYEDVITNLGIAYSLEDNFLEYTKISEARNFARLDNTSIVLTTHNTSYYLSSCWANRASDYNLSLDNMTLSISINEFNSLNDSQLSLNEARLYLSSLPKLSFELIKYPNYNPDDFARFQSRINISVHEDDNGLPSYLVSDDFFSAIRDIDMIPYAIYLTDPNNAPKVLSALNNVPFVPISLYANAALDVAKVVDIFESIFSLVGGVIFITSFSLLTIFGFDLIRKNKFNIGVMKSMGARSKDLLKIFIPQMMFISIFSIVIFVLSSFGLISLGNMLLINSFATYNTNPITSELTILTILPNLLVMDSLLILGISLVSILAPLLYLRVIKPINIIREKKL